MVNMKTKRIDMNIKLAEKVFHEAKYNYLFKCVEVKLCADSEWDAVEYEYCSDHKLKLIEWISGEIEQRIPEPNTVALKDYWVKWWDFARAYNNAIATNNTDKLVEIAESMLE